MNASKLASEITKCVENYGFVPYVYKKKVGDSYSVEFTTITTKTRASSIVTRLSLLSQELAGESRRFSVTKELMTDPPATRDDLATWRITVRVPIKIRSKAA
jgi:hypothetical protein